MPFTAQWVSHYRQLEADAFGAGGRIVAHHTSTVQVVGADRLQHQVTTVSAGVSALPIPLGPVGDAAPGSVLVVQTNQPLLLRLNDPAGAAFGPVVQLLLAASAAVSALYVTNPGALEAVLRLAVIGGGSLQASVPLP